MRYFRFEYPWRKIHLYPIVCWHIGAKQSSDRFISHVIERIREDENAVAIYMGDGGECVTKYSKGNIYEQLLSPGDQLRELTAILQPIKHKIAFGIRGNHGNRIDKETGVGWDEMLCARLDVPYFGVSAMGDILFKPKGAMVRKPSFSLYTHHGSVGAITPAGKMSAAHKPENIVLTDIALTAHSHACGEAWPGKIWAYTEPRKFRISHKKMRSFVCGSAYDSRSGYAEEKMYPVITPAHLMVAVTTDPHIRTGGISVSHEVIEGDSRHFVGEHELAKWRYHPGNKTL